MILYLAGLGGIMNGVVCRSCKGDLCFTKNETKKCGGGELFKSTNILQSFYYCNDFTEQVVIPNCKNFMLDSGACKQFKACAGWLMRSLLRN